MGDKNFKWYVASSVDAEIFSSKHDDREDALNTAKSEYGDDPFVLIEADQSVVKPNLNTDWIVEKIIEDLEENNPECWGEDGPDDPWKNIPGLEAAIQAAVAKWLIDNPPRTFCVDEFRTTEAFNGATT
ncbi:hypothetical protein J0664_05890 [Rhizobium leguminosarum]|uniref:hypothetical protein n=1 Tax=Rhizobium leguminosarum TaxID=384 RepID=UPI001A931FF6|nr:hypothetical protein [Rhizobium leguminosarum]MBY5553759.1 hypothetical protein [Rhizobium leguminosarum]QSW24830.1 hypothetical protein J0664_05890 [Rhizobium leguminosarum]